MGHLEGDQALVEVAQVLTMTFRQSDILSRLGGDEFVVFSSGVTREIVHGMAERLQQNLTDFSQKNNRPYVLSLSVGTVFVPAYSYYSIDQLLQLADQEMYENKKKAHPIYADNRHSCLSIRSPTCFTSKLLSSPLPKLVTDNADNRVHNSDFTFMSNKKS
jgi:diguanylate cyclase (GGDEF)-like protein